MVDPDVLAGVTSVSSTYAILATDKTILATSGTFTATLPTAVGVAGRIYVIKNAGTGTVTIAMSDFEPDFDPAAFFTLPLAALAVF